MKDKSCQYMVECDYGREVELDLCVALEEMKVCEGWENGEPDNVKSDKRGKLERFKDESKSGG